MNKWCSGCCAFLDASHFWRNKKTLDGYQYWCKGCMRGWRFTYREIERVTDRARRASADHRPLVGKDSA